VKQTIHSHVYENGLVLVAEPMMSVESAAFTLLVPAGCCYDPADRSGLAALTAEMSLRGAGNRDGRAFIHDLENLGVDRSESVSAAHIGYGGAMLAENLLPALDIYVDLLRVPHLPAEHFDAGRLVVLQELRAIQDEPAQQVMIELRRRQYPDPFGRPSQGDERAIVAADIGEVRRHFKQHYRPNGAILGVAGRFDWEALRDAIGSRLGDWPRHAVARVAEYPRRERRAHLPLESNQTQIGIGYASVPYRHPDYFLAWGAVGVLSGGMSSRLFTEVRERRGLCYSVYASLHTQRDRAAVLCYAGTSSDRAQQTLDVTLEELQRLAKGIEPFELDRLRARIKSALVMQQESSAGRSGAIARDWYHLQKVRTLDEVERLIDDLSCDRINAYLAEHPPSDFTVVTLGPQPLDVPVHPTETGTGPSTLEP